MRLLESRRGGPEICKTPQFSCTSATEPADMGQGKGELNWVALFVPVWPCFVRGVGSRGIGIRDVVGWSEEGFLASATVLREAGRFAGLTYVSRVLS
jgi:hypothetical protein